MGVLGRGFARPGVRTPLVPPGTTGPSTFADGGAPRSALRRVQERLRALAREHHQQLQATVEEWGWYPLTNFADPPNGSNFFGIGGYKTIAYEIVEASAVPEIDWVVVPLSMGDGLHGIWQGFVELEPFKLQVQ